MSYKYFAATESEALIHGAIEEMDNPALSACTSSPDYLRCLAEPARAALARVTALSGDAEKTDHLAVTCLTFASTVGNFLLHCRTTGNSSPDIELGESKYHYRSSLIFEKGGQCGMWNFFKS